MRLAKKINVIVACQKSDWGIAMRGGIPWRAPADMRHFREITSTTTDPTLQNAIVMGRKTFDTIGKPLPKRFNYVITRNKELQNSVLPNTFFLPNLPTALEHATSNPSVEKVFVIGGEDIYKQTFGQGHCIDKTFLTLIDTHYPCDQFIDKKIIKKLHYPNAGRIVKENGVELNFQELSKRNDGEDEYLNLLKKILERGERRENRTGVDTLSLFGERLEFDISQSIPFITTKRLAWKTMLRELLWFVSGDTNNAHLQEKNVHIWDGNASREYLDSIGLTHRQEGDLGPVYGFQWRHFGAEYKDCNTDYSGRGVDQLSQIVEQLKNDRYSRRIILSAWNPAAQADMALPPCHVLAQWYVCGDRLDCQMYQRSCDIALGVPFNIASYSVLTYMLAHLTGLQPGRYIQVMGDTHLYVNHIDAVKEQITRTPYPFPQLKFSRDVQDINDFVENDFIIDNYIYHPSIKMDMVV